MDLGVVFAVDDVEPLVPVVRHRLLLRLFLRKTPLGFVRHRPLLELKTAVVFEFWAGVLVLTLNDRSLLKVLHVSLLQLHYLLW